MQQSHGLEAALVLGANQEKRLSDQELVELFEFWRHPLIRFYRYLGTRGTEWNYTFGAPLSIYTQIQTAFQVSTPISPAAGLGISVGWNYLDGICDINQGLFQLFDEEDYRQSQNKVKGVINIISGLQSFLLSYNPVLTAAIGLSGGAALAPAAFAIALFADVVIAAIDFHNANKESEFEGWLDECAKNIAYKQQRIKEFELKLKSPCALGNNENRYITAKIKVLNSEIEKIWQDIYARSRVHCNKTSREFIPILESHLTVTPEMKQQLTGNLQPDDLKKDEEIQKRLTKNFNDNAFNLAFKAASFVGMALIALSPLCPALLIVGLILTACVAAFYIYKHKIDISDTPQQLRQIGFFKSSELDKLGKKNNEVSVFERQEAVGLLH